MATLASTTDLIKPSRRYDIDWLRIGAVLLLIPFHTARVFNADEAWYAKRFPMSTVANWFIDLVGSWHMSLLFVLAGASTYLAMRHRTGRQYAGERLRRLLVPFVAGLIVLVPPQTWIGARTYGAAHESFLTGYRLFWTSADADLTGYKGGFTPGHLWFIQFLFLLSLVALPAFLWLRRGGGRRLIDWFAAACRVPGVVLLPAVPLILTEPIDVLQVSGQNIVGYLILLLAGFVMVADQRITAALDRQRHWLLGLGAAGVVARVLLVHWSSFWVGVSDPSLKTWLVGSVLRELAAWTFICGLLGYGHRHLQRTNVVLRYATEAAYPFYIWHQTVIVFIAYGVVGWGLGAPLTYVVIAVASPVASLALYELVVRRFDPVRGLFGMKPRARTPQASLRERPAAGV